MLPTSPPASQPSPGPMENTRPATSIRYHVLTDDWRIWPWDCDDPGPLTVAEAHNVLGIHGPGPGKCGRVCVIAQVADSVLARAGQFPQETLGQLLTQRAS